MMTQAKIISCLLCRENVHFTYTENETYLDHLKLEHHIDFYRHLTLMINLMDKTYMDYYSNMNHVSKHKTLVCLLCRKENNFSDDEGDQYFSHLKNEHMIISNVQLIRSINLMDNDGLRAIIKKFEETYEVCNEVNNEEDKYNHYVQTNINSNNAGNDFTQNDTSNLAKKYKNEEEKMLIEDGSILDDSKTTVQRDQEEMFGELEEELLNGSEAMNYYKSKTINAERLDQANIKSQSETLLNHSNYANVSFPNDSMNHMGGSSNSSFRSNASLNSSSNVSPKEEFDSGIKLEDSNNLSHDSSNTPNRNPVTKKELESENSNFSEAVQKEIEKGNLSTTMDIAHEKTIKKMKELTGMFMNGTTCTVCDRGFNTKSHLHEHIESLHNPLPVYFCHVCQLPMTSSARLRQHKRKCSG